jgi:hypothetical protein
VVLFISRKCGGCLRKLPTLAAQVQGISFSRFNWGSYKFTMPHFFQLPIPLKLYSRFMCRLLPVLLVTSQRNNGLGLFLAHVIF